MNIVRQTKMKSANLHQRKRSRLIFYILIMLIPSINFVLFNIYVNINSILLAFQKYNESYEVSFAKFENFQAAFDLLKNSEHLVKNSLAFYFCSLFIGSPLALFFAFYLYKKYLFSGFYKVILFLPQIVSSVVLVVLFKYIVTDVYSITVSSLLGKTPTEIRGLLDNPDTIMPTLIFYNIWVSFSVNVLMYSSTMSSINESIVESAKLDGVNTIKEFWYITLPMIWPTFSTFLVVGLTGLFTNQAHLVTFFESRAGAVSTLGYFIYIQTLSSELYVNHSGLTFSELSALGLVLTAITVPIVLSVRKLLAKFGPSVE